MLHVYVYVYYHLFCFTCFFPGTGDAFSQAKLAGFLLQGLCHTQQYTIVPWNATSIYSRLNDMYATLQIFVVHFICVVHNL